MMVQWKVETISVVLGILCVGPKWSVLSNKIMGGTLLLPLKNTKESNCECGKLTKKVDDERLAKVRIAGGRVPWLVELITSYNNDLEEFRLCFGTLVSLQTVVFPASCINTNAKKLPHVRLLGLDMKKDSVREISSVLVHPNYRRKNDNDIALVKLKHVIDFNQTKVVPICLPPKSRSKVYPVKYPQQPKGQGGEQNVSSVAESMMHDNNGFADSSEDDPGRTRPCLNPNPPCEKRPCRPCPTTTRRPNKVIPTTRPPPPPPPPQYVLDNLVTRTWFYRKSIGYEYIQHFGRFGVNRLNNTKCSSLFPEMLQSKVACVQQKEIKDIVKQNDQFFKQLELGMPLILSNTTLAKGKPQPATTKYYLEGIRAPGSSGGIPLLNSRENAMAMLKIDDYIPWIRQNSHNGHFCMN